MKFFLFFLGLLPSFGADLLPLVSGNQWTYRDGSGATRQITVGLPLVAGGQVYYRVRGYAAEPLWLRSDAAGVYSFDEESARDRELLRFSSGSLITPISGCNQTAESQRDRTAYQGPVGRFNGALEVRFQGLACPDAGFESDTYLENIGLMRRIEMTIAGPRTWELVYAKVGSLTLEPGPRSSLSLSLEKPFIAVSAGEPIKLKATLRLTVADGGSLRMNFNSSQRYDLAVRDANGTILHTWSSTVLFLAVTGTENFVGTQTWQIDSNVPALLPGQYQVEAWITSDSQRQLTIATPLQVAQSN